MDRSARGSSRDSGGKRNFLRICLIVGALVAVAVGLKLTGDRQDGNVSFTQLTEDAIPQQMTAEIIPEYRDMERALACVIDDKVYVLACRGEKPTTGYDISIESMKLSEEEDRQILTVQTVFTDPQAGASLTQEATWPYVAAETGLQELPDEIQMKITYAD